jgi:hypothetical protein
MGNKEVLIPRFYVRAFFSGDFLIPPTAIQVQNPSSPAVPMSTGFSIAAPGVISSKRSGLAILCWAC